MTKTAAYAFTPGWLASLFVLIGGLGALLPLLAGLYGIYLLYLGLPITMKCPEDKAFGYTAAAVVCTILLAVAFGSPQPGDGRVRRLGFLGRSAKGPPCARRPARVAARLWPDVP